MTISYEHNFHGVVKIKIGKCRAVPPNTTDPDFYTRVIQLFDKDNNRIFIYLYGENVGFNDDSGIKAREISIELED